MAKTKPAPKPEPPAADYQVVARRYRPQQFDDLIGQEHVATALKNAIASGRIAHAYLFTGARGVGKTSCARILAKALNCATGLTATPCDTCDSCLGIAEGQDVDVPEIDGASNNKAEEARELRSNVGFRPTRSRFKIYIIDEVHMLSTAAFNVLLKTLEEPPSFVKFIFATTEVQKLPITILSRCQRFDFHHIGPTQIFDTLKHVVKREGLQAEDEALRLVAKRAAGSMRDAQSLLDQLLATVPGSLTAAAMHELLGTAPDDRVGALAAAILAKDVGKALGLVAEAADRGLHLGDLLDQLIDYWRGLMLVGAAGPDVKDLPGSDALHLQIKKHAAELNLDTILAGLDVLSAARGKMRGSPHIQVLVESAVVRLARMEDLLSITGLVQQLASAPRPVPADGSKKNYLTGPEAPVVRPNTPSPGTNGVHAPAATSDIRTIWDQVLTELGPMRSRTLRAAGEPAILGPNALALRFPAGYSQEYELAAAEPTLDQLQSVLKKLTGKEWTVRVERTAGLPAPLAEPPPPVNRNKDLMQYPLLKRIGDVLGGQLVRVEDGFSPTAEAVTVVTADPSADDPDALAPPDPDET
jgi:DNA polymerase-3 subunit gamma/tau